MTTSLPDRLRDYDVAAREIARVRGEADDHNLPTPGSGFADYMARVWPAMRGASCYQYSMYWIERMHALGYGPDRVRELGLNIRLNGGPLQYDSHSVVEFSHDGRWVVLDPTNGLALELAESGMPATKAEAQYAVRCGHPEWIRNRFLTPQGDHYIVTEDYEGQAAYYANCRPAAQLDYWDSWARGRYDTITGPVPAFAALHDPTATAEAPTTVTVTANGSPMSYPCNPVSWVISTWRVVPPAGIAWVMLRPLAFGTAPPPPAAPPKGA